MKRVAVFLFLVIFSIAFASAHIPRIVSSQTGVFEIKNPEISQAFYSELKAEPEYFKIGSLTDFNFHIQILVPDIDNKKTDFVAEIYEGNEIIKILYGSNFTWTKFHEDFANDDYLSGPEFNEVAGAGIYTIKVYNAENAGKYVLVVGQEEKFPILDIIKTVYTIPQEKIYFNKIWFFAYFTKISLFFFWPAIIFVIILILIIIKVSKKIKEGIKRKADKYCNIKRKRGKKSPIQQDEDLTEA